MNDKNCITFIWKICNLEVGVYTNGDLFFSPSFHVSSLRGSAWTFLMHTPSFDDLSQEIEIELRNDYHDKSSSNQFFIHFEFSILAVNPSLTCTYTFLNMKITEGAEHKITGLPTWETLLQKRKEYLPEDVMTIHCRLWEVNTRNQVLEPLFYKGLTHTGYKKYSLTWSINILGDFKKWVCDRCKRFDLGESEPVFNLTTCSDSNHEALEFNIQQLNRDFPLLQFFFKISVLDTCGKVVKFKQSAFDLKPFQVQKLDPFIAFSFLKSNRKHILKNNTLNLVCEFVYENDHGRVFTFIESVTRIPPLCIIKPAVTIPIENMVAEPPKEIGLSSQGLKEDLYDLYLSNSCSDVVLTAGICPFPCHKCVLSARSPVFRSLLSESTSNYNTELEPLTLAFFLQFLYTDDIGKAMDFQRALNLYEAAEKFQVLPLKSVCTKFLESNLTKQNACDVLILSSKYQDSQLKEFVENFILKNPLDILRSKRWKNLMKTDAKHVAETVC